MSPVLWRKLSLTAKLEYNEIILLAKYFNRHFEELEFQGWFPDHFVEILLKYATNLHNIVYNSVYREKNVELMLKYCKNLRSLTCRWSNLTNNHLIQIADNLIHLNSIHIYQFYDKYAYGLNYLIDKSKQIISFGLSTIEVKERLVKLLFAHI